MDGEFRDFFLREHKRVVLFLMRCGASLTSAVIAAQQAFTAARQLAKRGAWLDLPNKEAWIRTVAYDKYLKLRHLRLAHVTSASYLPEEARLRDSASDLTPKTKRVLKAFQGLPADQQVVMAFKMDRFPEDVIAVHLGITDQEVRERYEAARRALARLLAETTPKEENP
jgi:DNA-directed RNA polymerase specialized sigma24 family protein